VNTVTKPRLTAPAVRGLFIASGHADSILTDYVDEGREGAAEFRVGCEYLADLVQWYKATHPDFDVLTRIKGA
jgi:hypothetical protein